MSVRIEPVRTRFRCGRGRYWIESAEDALGGAALLGAPWEEDDPMRGGYDWD